MASGELLTVSDLYSEDVPEGSLVLPQYTTSCDNYADGFTLKDFFINKSKFIVYDRIYPPAGYNYQILKPHRLAAVIGDKLRLFCPTEPDVVLSRHWTRKLGKKSVWRLGYPGDTTKPHIVMFPMEKLPANLHSVNPEKHYFTFSKLFIPEIPCPQAKVLSLDSLEFPCVVKVAYGMAGKGTFMVPDEKCYNDVIMQITDLEPDCQVVVNRMVPDVIASYCCQFYLNRQGAMRWLGVTEQLMDASTGFWAGAIVSNTKQNLLEALLKPAVIPVASKLHEWEYFGVVGVDVLVSRDGSQFVVDVNPRFCGSTPMLLASQVMAERGWTEGIFVTGVTFRGSLDELVMAADSVKDGEVLVFCAVELGRVIECQLGIFSTSQERCQEIYLDFQQARTDNQ